MLQHAESVIELVRFRRGLAGVVVLTDEFGYLRFQRFQFTASFQTAAVTQTKR